jgi:hypothetical protein
MDVPFAGTSKLTELVEPRRVDVKFARKIDRPIIMMQIPDLNKTLDVFNLLPVSLKRKDKKRLSEKPRLEGLSES